jgi:hypothetical protein
MTLASGLCGFGEYEKLKIIGSGRKIGEFLKLFLKVNLN